MSKAGDIWRLRCPKGHVNWHPRNGGYYCQTCDEHFDDLVDAKHE